MSDSDKKNALLFTLLGSLGAILIFVLVIFLAYLPNRPEPIDTAIAKARQAKADEARAAAAAKLNNYVVAANGSVQIPITEAMELVVKDYTK